MFRKKIDSLPYGSPETKSRVELDIFRRLMSPEEAEIASKLLGELEDIQSISQRVGMAIEILEPILEELARKKVIFKLVSAPEPLYSLVPYMPGIFEFQERDIEKCEPELVELFEKYYRFPLYVDNQYNYFSIY